jgi:hypothetical protein
VPVTANADSSFPRAVRGEDYSRYAAAMWSQGVRWLSGEIAIASEDVTHHAYTVLRQAAVASVGRELYPQEQQLLSELIHREWDGGIDARARSTPEIPSFLRPPK